MTGAPGAAHNPEITTPAAADFGGRSASGPAAGEWVLRSRIFDADDLRRAAATCSMVKAALVAAR